MKAKQNADCAHVKFGDTMFYHEKGSSLLSGSAHAAQLMVDISMADLAVVQAGVETLMWQLFDKYMAESGAHQWLQISVGAPWFSNGPMFQDFSA